MADEPKVDGMPTPEELKEIKKGEAAAQAEFERALNEKAPK